MIADGSVWLLLPPLLREIKKKGYSSYERAQRDRARSKPAAARNELERGRTVTNATNWSEIVHATVIQAIVIKPYEIIDKSYTLAVPNTSNLWLNYNKIETKTHRRLKTSQSS